MVRRSTVKVKDYDEQLYDLRRRISRLEEEVKYIYLQNIGVIKK